MWLVSECLWICLQASISRFLIFQEASKMIPGGQIQSYFEPFWSSRAPGLHWMSLNVSGCLWMSLNVSECVWMSLNVSECVWMSLNVSEYLFLQGSISRFLIFQEASKRIPGGQFNRISSRSGRQELQGSIECLWMSLDVSECLWMFLNVSECLGISLNVSECLWMSLQGSISRFLIFQEASKMIPGGQIQSYFELFWSPGAPRLHWLIFIDFHWIS